MSTWISVRLRLHYKSEEAVRTDTKIVSVKYSLSQELKILQKFHEIRASDESGERAIG